MAEINFDGLMSQEDVVGSLPKTDYDFRGLMSTPTVEPIKEEPDKEYIQRLMEAPERVAELIDKRGTLWEQYVIQSNSTKDSNPVIDLGNQLLNNISVPLKMLEAGVANPIIEMQKGNLNPIDVVAESFKGFAGLKQGEFGDIGRMNAYPEMVSASAGLAASFVLPMALIKAGGKLKAVTKWSDSKVAKAISRFFKTMEKPNGAMNKVGAKVGAYYDEIGGAAVDKSGFLDEVSRVSSTVKRSIVDMPTEKLRLVDDELLNLVDQGTIKAAHAAKESVDDLLRSYFTSTSKSQSALRESSGALGKLIDDAAYKAQVRVLGEKAAKKYVSNFQRARKDYSVLKNGYAYIRNKLINPHTGELTKTGSILKEIADPREQNLRATLRSINKHGTGANRFANEILSIEKAIQGREFFGRILQGVGYGAVVGTTIGQTVGRARSGDTIIEREN